MLASTGMVKGIENYLAMGTELRLFEGEKLEHSVIDNEFLLYVHQGKIACEISRPDETTFRFITTDQGITVFANAITSYTKYSQSWDMVALENTILVAFTRETVYDIIKKNSDMAESFLDYASSYHTVMEKRVLLTANLTSSQRVLTWLYALCECEQPQGEKYYIRCDLNQQEIADILILHISTCNKIFTWLQTNGVIDRDKQSIDVNFPLLRQYIQEDWKIY